MLLRNDTPLWRATVHQSGHGIYADVLRIVRVERVTMIEPLRDGPRVMRFTIEGGETFEREFTGQIINDSTVVHTRSGLSFLIPGGPKEDYLDEQFQRARFLCAAFPAVAEAASDLADVRELPFPVQVPPSALVSIPIWGDYAWFSPLGNPLGLDTGESQHETT